MLRHLVSMLPHMTFRQKRVFEQTLNAIEAYEDLNERYKKEFIFNKMIEQIHSAKNNVDGYREYWEHKKWDVSDIQDFDDLSKIPKVNKYILSQAPCKFRMKKVSAKSKIVTTGGSTGFQLKMLNEPDLWVKDWASICWFWSKFVKYKNFSKKITIRGGVTPTLINEDPIHGITISTYHLSLGTIRDCFEAIKQSGIPILHAYPSSLEQFLKYAKKHGLRGDDLGIQAIFLGSENVNEELVIKLERFFDAVVGYWYGHTEMAIYAPFFQASNCYKNLGHYGYCHADETGKLIGTSFLRSENPFIAYETDDVAREFKPSCSGELHFKKIEGREHEYLKFSDGRMLALSAINMHGDEFEGIESFRFIQTNLESITFSYKPLRDCYVDETLVMYYLREKIGFSIKIKLKKVDEIEATKSGKHKFLESYVLD